MAVDGVQSGTTTPQTQSAKDRVSLGQDFDQFLRLLTTQLQNQDPLSPMDSTEFTNQLVQFSSVEQAIKQNDNLEKLLSMQTLNLTALGVSFIGKDVEVQGSMFEKGATGPVNLTYDLPETATSGTVNVLNEDGEVVWSGNAELTAGVHHLEWDGLDNSNQSLPAGTYEIRVAGLTAEKKALNITTYVPGYVSGLESAEDGSLMLVVGENRVPMTQVRKISEPAS